MRPRSKTVLFLDVPLALFIGLASFGTAQFAHRKHDSGDWQGGGPPWWSDPEPAQPMSLAWTALPFLILVMAGVALRRLFPRTGLALTAVGAGGYLALGHPVGVVLVAPALALLALANQLPVRRWIAWTILLPPMITAAFWSHPYGGFLEAGLYRTLIIVMLLFVLPVMIGVLRRNREEVRRLDRAQELRRSAYEERLRIAREVHDVVGHSLSVISMQAGVALHVLQKRPDQVEASLEAIRRSSKDALLELRGTLAVFHEPGPGEPRAPQPGLGRLDDLVASLQAGGHQVTVVVDGTADGRPPTLPASVDHAAYRIIQEALTNVVRHANGANARVSLLWSDGTLTIEVTDDGPEGRPPDIVPSNGISGMRERARAIGGTLDMGHVGGRVLVRAQLPATGEGR